MRVSFILFALAAFAVASPIPVPTDKPASSKLADGAIEVGKALGKHAIDAINNKVQEHWSEEGIAAKNAKKEKVAQSAAEVKMHGLDALKTAANIGKGLAAGSAGKKSYLSQQ